MSLVVVFAADASYIYIYMYIHSYLRNPDIVGTDPLSGFAKIPDFTSLRNPD